MTCRRNATSEMSRLFFAVMMKRRLGKNPNPCNKCWLSVKRNVGVSAGLKLEELLVTVVRELSKLKLRFVPVWKPWVYPKLYVALFCSLTLPENREKLL